MKYLYRISLTFMVLTISSASLLCAFYFYQYKNRENQNNRTGEQDQIQETAADLTKTDCDTEYVILEQDIVEGTSETLVTEIPAKYIGKTKEQLISILEEEEKAPSLRERQKGIQSVRLSAFSNERVVVVKTYERAEETANETTENKMPDGYYLLANNGFVYVYKGDMETLCMTTEILLNQLPEDVRQEILDKKYVKNEEELYNFLESYSS
jgi:hypothetical protein